MKDKLRELVVALAKECSESDKYSRIRVATVRFFIKKMLAILDADGWLRVSVQVEPSKPDAGVVSDSKCPDCLGYGEHCLAGCSAHPDNWYKCEACKGTGLASSHARQVPDVSEQLVDAIRHRVGCEDGLDITPAQVRCVLKHERIIAAPPAPEKD